MMSFCVGLLLGAIAIVAVEAVAVLYLIKRLIKKTKKSSSSVDSGKILDPQQSLDYAYNKQGVVWVLESEKVPKNWFEEKVPKEQKRNKKYLEVSPVRKYAKILDHALHLTESDGSQTAVPLIGCIVEAVAGSSQSSRKWYKKFPIKVEGKTSVIYNTSKTIYIFLETSWEKESWCKALRLASCDDKKRLDWFTHLNEEFHSYLASLNTGYPSFMKSSVGLLAEPIDRASRLDGSSSKVRHLWRKLTRKASKPSMESKAFYSWSTGREERKIPERFRPPQDPGSRAGMVKSATTKVPNRSGEDNVEPLPPTIPRSESQSHISVISDADSEDRFIFDEGTLCWNLLISRLFFDAKNNAGLKSSIQARIQRTLSNMRTPSFFGEIICSNLDTGNLPPYVHGMRVLPTDMNEVWAFEVDIEYAGGAELDVETRLEVCDLDVQKDIVDANSESSSVRDASSDLLEGFEYLGKQLNISEGIIDGKDQKNEGGPKLDGLKDGKSTVAASTYNSRWKSILNSIAKQVCQVPLSLSIKIASLRGTMRLHIKPPPSDQLWFGFTSMPDIEFSIESCVGDHKITNAHLASLLISRFKAAMRENMVLPNCESVCIPWMLAEKNDWIPWNVAPFVWVSHEATIDHTIAREALSFQPGDLSRTPSMDRSEGKHQIPKKVDGIRRLNTLSAIESIPSASPSIPRIPTSKSFQELRTPLLVCDEPEETCQENKEEIRVWPSPSRSLTQLEKQNYGSEEDDSKPRKMGRRARMLDLGKKMGEKLEEKRRNIEEKSRIMVEKMIGP